MLEALIAGLCTVVAGALSATITRYGWSFWRPARLVRCSGIARELRAIQEDGKDTRVQHNTQYSLRDGALRIRGTRTTFSAHLTMLEAGNTLAAGRMSGSGPFYNGYAYLQYTAEDQTRHQS